MGEKPKYTERDMVVAKELARMSTALEAYLEHDRKWKETTKKEVEQLAKIQKKHSKIFMLIAGAVGSAVLGFKKFISGVL